MSKLIERAKQIKESLDLEKLAKSGFRKELKSRADSHHTVTYPELKSMVAINQEDIFNQSSETKDLSLYFHIPFCTGRCTYCKYISFTNQSDEKVQNYLSALEKEIQLASKLQGVKNSRVNAVYIGGGTPTYLSPIALKNLLTNIKENFNINQNAEFTLEASPETILGEIGEERLDTLKRYGVNRLSIGIQTFNDSILSSVKRRHNSQEAIQAINNAEKRFRNINLDLIPGLPYQTLEDWENDLNIISEIKIPSVTTYPLTISSEAVIHKLFREHPEEFPNENFILLMRIMAIENLEKEGYKEYPAYWFTSSPKFVYQQEIHKWEDNGNLLALGITGYSWMNNWQYFNFKTLKDYFASLESGKLPIWKGAHLPTLEEQARRNLVLGIRCKIDKSEFQRRYGFNPEEKFANELKKLENLGLIENSEREIKLTYTGRLLEEEVARSFIP